MRTWKNVKNSQISISLIVGTTKEEEWQCSYLEENSIHHLSSSPPGPSWTPPLPNPRLISKPPSYPKTTPPKNSPPLLSLSLSFFSFTPTNPPPCYFTFHITPQFYHFVLGTINFIKKFYHWIIFNQQYDGDTAADLELLQIIGNIIICIYIWLWQPNIGI